MLFAAVCDGGHREMSVVPCFLLVTRLFPSATRESTFIHRCAPLALLGLASYRRFSFFAKSFVSYQYKDAARSFKWAHFPDLKSIV